MRIYGDTETFIYLRRYYIYEDMSKQLIRGVKCKHIFAVEISFALRKEVEVARIEPLEINCCIFCNSSNIVKDGLRHNKRGDIQKYNCRECNRYFT